MGNPGGWIRWLGALFVAIAMVLAAISFWLLDENRRFIATAQRAEGVVTRLEWTRRVEDTSASAYAFIRFADGDRPVEIRSRTASSPPAFAVGDKVVVLYQPGEAEQARIDNFWEQYLLPMLCGVLGIVFAIVGGALILIPGLGRGRCQRALTMGTPVQAKVIEVRLDPSTSVDGHNPWVIVAEYHDENENCQRTVTSHALWVDPRPYYAAGSNVTVFCLPEKPSIYAFDLDKLAEPS